MQQGIIDGCGGNLNDGCLKRFCDWVVNDVKKESKQELEESKLAWDKVEIGLRARTEQWARKYIEQQKHKTTDKPDADEDTFLSPFD